MGDDPVDEVIWMVRGAWVTMLLRAGCLLGVFDQLEEPRAAAEVARSADSERRAMTRLLNTLATIGLVEHRADDTYLNTALGSTLTSQHPSDLRSLVLMQSWLPNVATWNHLADAVRTGASVYERVNGSPPWEHLSAHPDQEAVFNHSMARRADGQVAAILAGIDVADAETIVDVGGGRGAMLAGVLRAWPRVTGVLADRPDVAAEADTALAEMALSERAHGLGCDFFESVPSGGDLYFLSNVLHDWDDDHCVTILRTVRRAMDDRSRLVVVERLLDAPGRSAAEVRDLAFLDLHMLVMFGARERTKAEYDALLSAAGFTPSRLASAQMAWNVLEARPAH
jgi:hypothetical protein